MEKTMVSQQTFPSLLPSSHAPHVSLAPKTPFPFPQTLAMQATFQEAIMVRITSQLNTNVIIIIIILSISLFQLSVLFYC